jgi:hypothetical protein
VELLRSRIPDDLIATRTAVVEDQDNILPGLAPDDVR